MGAVRKSIISFGRSTKILLLYHRYAIFAAIIVACIAGLPQVIARDALGSADKGIPYLVNDSEGEYLARIHELFDGHWSVSSPVLYEYKDSIALMPPVGEFIFYALPAMLTGASLSTVVFLSRFLYPALLFLFAYLFILSLLNKDDKGARFSAIAVALLITIGYDSTNFRSLISYIMNGVAGPVDLLWNRLVNPITGAMLLFAFLWLLSRIVKERSDWLIAGISGLVLAAMSGYIFSFALGLSVPVLIGFYFIWRKEWNMTLRIYAPVAIALALNATYFVGVFLAMRGAAPLSDPLKSGMYLTHEPMLNVISLATLGVVALCLVIFFGKSDLGEREKRWWFLALATAAASVFVYYQQVITGRTVAPQHFVQYTKPLAMAIGIVLLHNIVRERAKNLWRVAIAAIFIVVAISGWRILSAVRYSLPQYANLQSFSGVFDYLNKNAPRDCVVYVSSDYGNEINRFIPAFTGCNVYHSYYIYNGVPADRITHNYLVNLRLRDVKLNNVEKHFKDSDIWARAYFFRDYGDMFCCGDRWLKKIGDGDAIARWFALVEKDVEKKYSEYLKGNLYSQLTRYRLDYFVVDTEKQPQVDEKRYPFLSLKGMFGRFAVYAMMKP